MPSRDSNTGHTVITRATYQFGYLPHLSDDELNIHHYINLQNESCSHNETDPLENFKQAGELGFIENNFINEETILSSKSFHLQSSTIVVRM